MGNHSLLQGIFLTQGPYSGLLQCRQIPYHLSHQVKADNTILILGACVCAQLLSRVQLFVIPWTMAYQVPLSMGFSRSGLPFPPPGDLPDFRDQTRVSCISCIVGGFFTSESPGQVRRKKDSNSYRGEGGLGGAVINKESVEGNWEIRVQWFFIVQVVLVSLTGLLWVRRNSSFLLLDSKVVTFFLLDMQR